MQSNCCKTKSAFTIVELLVVIAILAVLFALLMPVAGKARYTANSIKCLNEKRQVIAGLVFYAGDHQGQFPYREDVGGGQIQNPHDHHCHIINELQQSYGIPYGMWVCAVYKPDLAQRSAIVSNAVAAGLSSPYYWKWIAPAAVGYWVEQGGPACSYVGRAPAQCGFPFQPNISPRGLYTMTASTVVITDLMYCSVPGQPSGGQHTYRGQIIHSNLAFADGHAEVRSASEVRNRFNPWGFGY
jgi:prepilin-type N-terminal cleavage/methylation domain-containing protein/prepilin-type processing-associated H-X9-DG protein